MGLKQGIWQILKKINANIRVKQADNNAAALAKGPHISIQYISGFRNLKLARVGRHNLEDAAMPWLYCAVKNVAAPLLDA